MPIAVLITTKSLAEAKKISHTLVEEKVVACVNIIQGVQSVFWWKEKVNESKEVLLIVKTRRELFKRLVERVKALHSYEVPEIIALPIVDGSADYLKWIDQSVKLP